MELLKLEAIADTKLVVSESIATVKSKASEKCEDANINVCDRQPKVRHVGRSPAVGPNFSTHHSPRARGPQIRRMWPYA